MFAFVLSTVAGTAAAQPPRTPWGHPDLQGTYTNATQTVSYTHLTLQTSDLV